MSYLDKLAYELYVDAVNRDIGVSEHLVGHINKFVEEHNFDEMNSSHYYDLALKQIKKIRKEKLKKLSNISNDA
jgi:hypothetical protein